MCSNVRSQLGVVYKVASASPSRARNNYNWVAAKAGSPLASQVQSDTKPERQFRKALHRLGFRYRLRARVGGFRPDLVLKRYRAVIFIDGCWWHQCPKHCHWKPTGPNGKLWSEKFERNRTRDKRAVRELTAAGYLVLRLWECDVRDDLMNVVREAALTLNARHK